MDPRPAHLDPERRHRMVIDDLVHGGIADRRVLDAFEAVPRELFVPAAVVGEAYEDRALPIGEGQTISQPLMVAIMLQALELEPHHHVLEVGAGSGYVAALLSRIVDRVHAIERLVGLADAARDRLARWQREADGAPILLRCSDGTLGWPEAAPFDRILVSAGGPHLPPPLVEQVVPGGTLVMPVGRHGTEQRLVRLRRTDGGEPRIEDLGAVRFVPLVGDAGWPEDPPR